MKFFERFYIETKKGYENKRKINLVCKDIAAMLSRLNDLPTDQGFPAGSKFYVFQEVIDQNDG